MKLPLMTSRLVLRPWSKCDTAAFFAIQGDPDNQKFLHTTSDEQESRQRLLKTIEDLNNKGYGLLAISLKETGEIIGMCGLQQCQFDTGGDLQLLIAILPSRRQNGFGLEALVELLRWAYEDFNLPRVLGLVNAENKQGLALINKLHGKYVGERPFQWPGEKELVYEFLPPSDDT